MKRLLHCIYAFIIMASSFILSFAFVHANNVASAASAPSDQVLEGVIMTQDGHTITSADFEEDKLGNLYLYTNATITINKISQTGTLEISYNNAYLAPILANKRWVLEYNEQDLIDNPPTTAPLVTLTLTAKSPFEFYLIQTPNHFKVNPAFKFKDKDGDDLVAPTQSQTFANFLTLINIVPTALCPTYIDLYYNGEFFSIRSEIVSDQIKFFNNITNNPIDINSEDGIKFNAAGQYEIYIYDKTAYSMMQQVHIDKDKLPSSYSHTEDIDFECLDLEHITSSTFANIQSYAFSISNTEHNMYITAQNEDGNDVLNDQTSNSSVKLTFHNLNSRQSVDLSYIKLLTKASNFGEETEQIIADDNDSFDRLSTEGYLLTADASYKIRYYDSDDNVILPAYDKNGDDYAPGAVNPPNANMFAFSVVKDIHTSYRGLIAPEINKITTKVQDDIIVRYYTGIKETVSVREINPETQMEIITNKQKYISGINQYTYSVMLANPDTKISGVANGGSTDGTTKITINGVGKIETIVTFEGKTITYMLENGSTVPETSNIGKYSVKIIDQMGNTASLNFSVKKPLNFATIALIIASVAIVAIVVVLIIKTRTKINVR